MFWYNECWFLHFKALLVNAVLKRNPNFFKQHSRPFIICCSCVIVLFIQQTTVFHTTTFAKTATSQNALYLCSANGKLPFLLQEMTQKSLSKMSPEFTLKAKIHDHFLSEILESLFCFYHFDHLIRLAFVQLWEEPHFIIFVPLMPTGQI